MHRNAILLLLVGNVVMSSQTCLQLPEVPHVKLQNKKDAYNPGDTITFTCDTGYIGRPIRHVCMENGDWSPYPNNSPCRAKPCVLPDDILNGYYQLTQGEDFVFGTVIKYFCHEGYQMASIEDTRTCMVNGWSNHLPVCEPLSCNAPPPTPGVTVEGLPMDDGPILPDRLLTFSCIAPHSALNGSETLTCGNNGKWDKPFPNCVGTCDVGPVPDSVQVSPHNRKQLLEGQSLHFRCKRNSQVRRGIESVRCLENGQWSNVFPTCTDPGSCGPPPLLENGDFLDSASQFKHNSRVHYQCLAKYTIHGSHYKICQNGVWTGDITCLKPCTVNPELMQPHKIKFRHGDANKLYAKHDEPIGFECVEGATHDGNVALRQTCNNGVMPIPTCV